MQKVIRLVVLLVISTATVLMPLGTTLADIISTQKEYIKREIDSMKKKMETGFSPHNFSIHSNNHSSHSMLSTHHPYSTEDYRHVNRQSRKHSYHNIERKTHRYVERKTTKTTTHRHIHEYRGNSGNSGDTLAASVLGLAAGAILGNILKQPQQPQIVYQVPPQNRVIYQEVPQNKMVYQVQQTMEYQPTKQPWTTAWLEYCTKKYRSFNPKTGTFRGYDGLNHFCYAPLN
ncbi:BA14K family protein [Bartonella alsatica]|uniref:Lectin-like protein BA14k n=2 Tax=Bartonella alsatica TaxID=52764 RepID=J0PT12_9HYPH|nr:BA14K family protein [Bartonella alsatica]EJF75666.1 hypothetical protein MEC_00221 [Bartonella alsatica IBS 382]QLC51668.1 BA14K family protein [Bartonella alsatica]